MKLDSYQIFMDNISSLKETSKDYSDINNVKHMTDSELKAVNFDMVKRAYANALGLSEEVASSVDAVAELPDGIAFVEFKNGKVNNRNVKDKVRDSLLIFNGITGKEIDYTRENINFIVVYNVGKNPLPNKKKEIQESESRVAISKFFVKKSGKELIRFDLERYKKLYFKDVHTFSAEEFNSYLNNLS